MPRKGSQGSGKRRRRGKGKRKEAVSPAELMELFLGIELLSELPQEVLKELAAGKATLKEASPGEELLSLAAGRAQKGPVVVLAAGSARLTEPSDDDPRALNLLQPGEAFFDRAYDPNAQLSLRLEAVQPVRAVLIPYAEANGLLRSQPAFKTRFMDTLRVGTERKSELFDAPERAEVGAFLSSQGLVGVQRVKVKRLDTCIDCDACFEACAERRGVSRLGDYKGVHARIGLPRNCHSCANPACMQACRFGHIRVVAGELQISDDCAGCNQCARACPYDAITTLPLDAVPDGYLDRSPKAKGRQLAVKCDDCVDWGDQACISTCPTGAIFQIASPSLEDYATVFAARSERALKRLGKEGRIEVERPPWVGWRILMIAALFLSTVLVGYESIGRMFLYQSRADTVIEALVEAGLNRSTAEDLVSSDGPDVYQRLQLTLRPLEHHSIRASKAKAVQKALRARKKPPWEESWRTRWYSITAALYHLGVRSVAPPRGGAHYMRPGNNLSLLLGYLGAFAMLLSQLYRVRRDVGARLGSMRTWLEFHIYTGYLGGVLIFFHASYSFGGYVFWLCFVPMIIAILTGVLGRYVYYLIPRSQAGRAMDSGELADKLAHIDERIGEIFASSPVGKPAGKELRDSGLLAAVVQEQGDSAWWTTLARSFSQGLRQRTRAKRLAADLQRLCGVRGKERRRLAGLAEQRVVLATAAQRLRSLEILSGSWRQVHIWASYLMFVAMMIHTVYAWVFLGPRAIFAR